MEREYQTEERRLDKHGNVQIKIRKHKYMVRPPIPAETVQKVKDLKLQGMAIAKISRKLDITEYAVHKILTH